MRHHTPTIQDLEDLPPLHSAARQGNSRELQELIQAHPDLVDYVDNKNLTAIMHAVVAKSIDCVALLIEAGAKLDMQDTCKRSALFLATQEGWDEGVRLLILYGAQCDIIDYNRRNVIHYASCTKDPSCLETLISKTGSSEVNGQDVEGMTPLHWSAFYNMFDHTQLLLKNGANPSIKDNEGRTALHWAAQNGCVSACRALLSSSYCKDIINLLDNTGKCPLHFAAIIGHLDCVFEIGQGSGCNTETKDRDGRFVWYAERSSLADINLKAYHLIAFELKTALHWATLMKKERCVAGLLRLGVVCDPKDKHGITPFTYAKRLGNKSCVNIFKNHDPSRPHKTLIPVEAEVDHNNNSMISHIKEQKLGKVDDMNCEYQNVYEIDQFNIRQAENKADSALHRMEKLNEALAEITEETEREPLLEPDLESSTSSDSETSEILMRHNMAPLQTLSNRGVDRMIMKNIVHIKTSGKPGLRDTPGNASDDEERYIPQMAVTPLFGSPVGSDIDDEEEVSKSLLPEESTSTLYGGRKVESLSSPRMHSPRNNSNTSYKLAPLEAKRIPNHLRVRHFHFKSNSKNDDDEITIELKTTGAFKVPSITGDDYPGRLSPPSLSLSFTPPNNVHERPHGLRRKSLSVNDGINILATEQKQSKILLRSQSYSVSEMKKPSNTLPMIPKSGQRSLIKYDKKRQYRGDTDEGYEGLDEDSAPTKDEFQKLEKRKKKAKRKYRFIKDV